MTKPKFSTLCIGRFTTWMWMALMELSSNAIAARDVISGRYGQPRLRLAVAGNGSSCSLWTPPRVSLARSCHQGRKRRGAAATVGSSSSSSSTIVAERDSDARELVDALLSLVDGSDRGAMLGEQERSKVEHIIGSLEQQCMPEPLKSPFLFGEWDVVYSSNPTATGGYYRSAIGRALLKTKQMMQIVKEPDFVSNKVSFAALGLLDGEVSLKGKLEALDNRWIKISFDSPDLKVGPFKFQYGGTSSVKIAIIYLDERVRLGRGSRGSLFVFKRW